MIACMRPYSCEDLLHLLDFCASRLALAYQDLLQNDLFRLSEEAYRACEYLRYELNKKTYAIH